jgi:hypothetical protein
VGTFVILVSHVLKTWKLISYEKLLSHHAAVAIHTAQQESQGWFAISRRWIGSNGSTGSRPACTGEAGGDWHRLSGILFARGRRTVTTWLRGAGIQDEFADYYYFLQPLGRKVKEPAARLLTPVGNLTTLSVQKVPNFCDTTKNPVFSGALESMGTSVSKQLHSRTFVYMPLAIVLFSGNSRSTDACTISH